MDKCALCGYEKELRKSHYLPKAIYRICGSDPENPGSSVLIKDRRAVILPRQAFKPFLCGDCECRLSAMGENEVMGNCIRRDGTFPLRDQVIKAIQNGSIKSEGFSLKNVIGSAAEAYVYFAVSMFWKAAETEWDISGSVLEQIQLGSALQEGVRQWLIGSSHFPTDIVLGMSIFKDSDLKPLALFPVRVYEHAFAMYRFVVPGIQFALFTEKAITLNLSAFRKSLPSDLPVHMVNFAQSGSRQAALQSVSDSSAKGKLKDITSSSRTN